MLSRHALPDDAVADLRHLLAEPLPLFGESHVPRLKEMWGIRSSFSMPLLPELAAAADAGVPAVCADGESYAARLYTSIADALITEVSAIKRAPPPTCFYSSADNLVLIAIADGSMQKLSPVELRRVCRSPANNPDALPADLAPLDFVPMGNYAVSVRWSDGHQSLLPYSSFVEGYDG